MEQLAEGFSLEVTNQGFPANKKNHTQKGKDTKIYYSVHHQCDSYFSLYSSTFVLYSILFLQRRHRLRLVRAVSCLAVYSSRRSTRASRRLTLCNNASISSARGRAAFACF